MTTANRFDPQTVEEVTAMLVAASERSLQWFRQPLTVENKGSGRPDDVAHRRWDPVTGADRAVEDELRAGLRARFPGDRITGEERGTSEPESGPTGPAAPSPGPTGPAAPSPGPTGPAATWIIDPIDGTRAFVTGQPQWGTLLGCVVDDRPVAGWLHQPTLGHTYLAAGEMAELRDGRGVRPLETSGTEQLGDAVLLCTTPEMFAPGREREAFDRVSARCRLTRFSGDCLNYGYLATGYADLVIEHQLEPYDIIPLIPLVEAAGGTVTGIDGESATGGGWAVAAATPALHEAALALLQGSLRSPSRPLSSGDPG